MENVYNHLLKESFENNDWKQINGSVDDFSEVLVLQLTNMQSEVGNKIENANETKKQFLYNNLTKYSDSRDEVFRNTQVLK